MSSAGRLVSIVSSRKNTATMTLGQALVLLASAFIVSGQRPFFAGSRPIGFPELLNKTTTTPSGLEDKFGEVTTQRLPIEAQGDRELIDRLSKLPIDKQPFWFINWQALEADRQKPQTYPQKPNPFLEPTFQNTVPQTQNVNPIGNSNPGFTNPNTVASPGHFNSGSGVQSPNWKLEDPNKKDQDQLNNKNGDSNADKPKNTEASTPGCPKTSTNIDSSNSTPGNVNKPGLVKEGLHREENEFADIEVKKLVKNN